MDISKYLKTFSWITYLVSFFLPVFHGDGSPGFLAFILGLITFPLPWMANMFYIIALFLNKKKSENDQLICTVLAIALACATFSIHEIENVGSKSGPSKVSVGVGFFFWFGSFILMLIGILVGKYADHRISKKLPPPLN